MFKLTRGTRVCWLLSLAALALALCGLAATAVDEDMGEPGASPGPAPSALHGTRRAAGPAAEPAGPAAEPAGPAAEAGIVEAEPAAGQRRAGTWPRARLSSVCTKKSLPAYTFDRLICSVVRMA